MKEEFFNKIYSRLKKQSTEATLGVLGVKSEPLRKYLLDIFTSNSAETGSMLSDPVFEAVYPWKNSKNTFGELAGFLQPSLIEALNCPKDEKEEGVLLELSKQALKKEFYPYEHQIKAWDILSKDKPKSIVVTSGTGSGKTECFMVPILNDLVKQHEESNKSLKGVQALFIYPLNALINSQRNRLLAWTQPYGKNVRFCLYNGNTPKKKKAYELKGLSENEVHTREQLWESAPPVLITNPTMLEYMLIRQEDKPILDQSQGKLKYIVLDEAHTYIGSQAAELSLLIRRTLLAFNVEPKSVRFIATSATIGNDPSASSSLKQYLADLAGLATEDIEVIPGSRVVPIIPLPDNLSDSLPDDFEKLSYGDKKSFIYKSKLAWELREFVHPNNAAKSLSQINNHLIQLGFNISKNETLVWLDACSLPEMKENDIHFLPLRGHMFHRVLNGLWVCSNPNCSEKINTHLEDDKWKFGKVYTDRRPKCECDSPVFELAFCNDCNSAHLVATERGDVLLQNLKEDIDEFEIDQEIGTDDLEDIDFVHGQNDIIISSQNFNDARQIYIDNDGVIQAENIGIKLFVNDDGACPSCGFSGQGQMPTMRKSYLGMPFYNSSIVPTLLENTKSNDKDTLGKPFQGKSLITFTDSRQGSARIAVKMQQDAERNRLRGLVYHIVNESSAGQNKDEVEKSINDFKRIPNWENIPVVINSIAELEKQLKVVPEVAWSSLIEKLSNVPDIERFMLSYYKRLDSIVFSHISSLANVLLIREFSRRPRRANSLETLGMVSIQYPLLKSIKIAPKLWERNGFTLDEWTDFLKVILDYFVRDGLFVEINRDWKNWLGGRYSPKSVLPPDSDQGDRFNVKWPQYLPERVSRQNRIVRLLAYSLKYNLQLSLDDSETDVINSLLHEAWVDLTRKTRILTDNAGDGYFKLKLDKLSFSSVHEAWYCPVTLRLLDTTLRGVTPFLPIDAKQGAHKCEKVTLPEFPNIVAQNQNERTIEVRNWQETDEMVCTLRERGIWTNLSDIISEGGVFFRSEEHSAQQDHKTLRKYEKDFQDGKINVLSCSTTMEMGVDIGGLSIVMNNNVPPHPSNYLQRAGRAGRRGESRSLSLTLCKNNPLDIEVFRKPTWPFKAEMRQPNITLQSKRIVQRHINAYLFGYFLNYILSDLQQNAIRLKNDWFFSASEEYQSICDQFIEWIKKAHENIEITKAIKGLKKQSILEDVDPLDIFEISYSTLDKIKSNWIDEHERLLSEKASASEQRAKDNNPYVKRVERELKRMEQEFLLSELVTGGYLPGYGFPTGIVPFNNLNINNFKGRSGEDNQREDNNARYRSMPTRNISMALSEYAPGSQIVIDGKVYRSSGLTLNWHIPSDASSINEDQKIRLAWRCRSCGNSGSAGAGFDKKCTECHTNLEERDLTEFIVPSGFAVNFYDEPSNNVSSQVHIPSKESWVIANGSLNPMPNEAIGYFKTDSYGHIFTHNSGVNNQGYALCLACGYADSLTGDGELPASFRNHRKLRGNIIHDDDKNTRCNPGEYQIKWPIHLGSEESTDVFELYLKNIRTGEFLAVNNSDNKKLCWSIGTALRYGLSKCLGINNEEIGLVINKRRIDKSDNPVYSIGLFDIYGGGSGFSTLAPFYIEDIFRYAKELLQCPGECNSSCEKCLTQPGQYRISEFLDRRLALDYLNDEFLNLLSLHGNDKLLGEQSKFCPENLFQELNRTGKSYSKNLDIFLNGPVDDWDLGNSNWKQRLLGYINSFEQIILHIKPEQFEQLSEIEKISLFGLLSVSSKLQISLLEREIELDRGFFLIRVSNHAGESISYATSHIEACIPREMCLNTNGFLLVKSKEPFEILSGKIEKDILLPKISNRAFNLDIKKELNGSIPEFGQKFWNIFKQNSGYIDEHLKSNDLKTIEYSDRYLQTPLSMLLLNSIVKSIPAEIGHGYKIKINSIRSKVTDYSTSRPLFKSWVEEEEDDRKVVMESLFSRNDDFKTEITFYNEVKELSHARTLKLSFSNESSIDLSFDQGMGYWRLDSYAKYPFDEIVEEQLAWIYRSVDSVKVKNDNDFATFIFVKLND